ncbi:WYL domain-containing protein [Gleimia sp. 6138-11-ORH1]|uniref:helix-turn-helix transcriptional regulator n=1 Tax=Gleimia sp. 6138-11-ORH1 TaxID=2973937 RepID=UPI002169DA29|nr:WYL domain-containing protein [Gleimia sp. 6138-11-ORH1]MCS4484354.1 WYL domain-containing protein [Gleimia sp. 6138-11-ORH1]
MATKLRDRLAGIFSLIEYVQLRGSCDLEELAKQFQMDREKLRELLIQLAVIDLPHLSLDDLPVVDLDLLDENIVEFLSIPDLQIFRFSKAEAQVLLLGLSLLEPTFSAEKLQASRRLADQLVTHFELADFRAHLEVVTSESLLQIQQTLGEALQDSKWISFTYQNASGEVSERIVFPQNLEIRSGNLLLDGYCETAAQTRSFRVSRMKDVDLLDAIKSPPLVSEKRLTRQRFPQVEVVFKRLPEELEPAALRIYESKQGVIAVFRLLDRNWLRSQLLYYADLVVACSDRDLLVEICERAEQTLQLYDLLETNNHPMH